MTSIRTSRTATTTRLTRFVLALTIPLALLAPVRAAAQEAEVSANAGFVSQYF